MFCHRNYKANNSIFTGRGLWGLKIQKTFIDVLKLSKEKNTLAKGKSLIQN